MNKTASWLCLGDSYTIGEGVLLAEGFPYQTIELLRRKNFPIHAPELVAKTGWTTAELLTGIATRKFEAIYDFVTLLIGVNNQYRGGSTAVYATEFELLLKQALTFTGNRQDHVIVLSIPDWGVTPFAKGKDQHQISADIDRFNGINQTIAISAGVHYLDITPGTRHAIDQPDLIAQDGLHPSALLYSAWALAVANKMQLHWPVMS